MLRVAVVGLAFGVAVATAFGQGVPEPQHLPQAMHNIEYAELGVAVPTAFGQELPEPQQFQRAMDNIEYAELLNAAGFTPEQLDETLRIRAALEAEAVIGPGLARELTKMLAAVLTGMSADQAQQALGEQQQLVQQARQRMQQAQQRSIDELQALLTDPQRDALVWFNSPARALDGAINAVAQARNAEDAQWNQFRTQASQALSRMSSQADPGGGASVETVGGLLDQARAMDDATFEEKRATLGQEWLQTLMPNVAQMLQNPQFRQERLRGGCVRLITYERGSVLIQAKRDAIGTQ